MSNVMFRRSDAGSKRGPNMKVRCFDCGEMSGAVAAVYRRSDGKPIDWSGDGRYGALVVYVHRGGVGCNKGRSGFEVRGGKREAP